jgi:hypothetical protein
MKPTGMCPAAACYVVLGILTACTTNGPAPPTASSPTPVMTQPTSQIRASDRMFYWREEARELHAMATHRDREAEFMLRKKPGSTTHEFVKQMQQLAHQLHQEPPMQTHRQRKPNVKFHLTCSSNFIRRCDDSLKTVSTGATPFYSLRRTLSPF